MKTDIVTTLIALYLPVSAFAITLRFPADVDLLILDGKKVSNSLLRSADSVELDNGSHQLVFRVEKTIHLSNDGEQLYISPPLMVSFNIQLTNQVNFRLPCLENERETGHFDATSCLELLDGDTTPAPIRLDIFAITSAAEMIDYKVEVEHYNKPAKRASLPQFIMMMVDNSTLLSGISGLDAIPLQSQVPIEQRLKYQSKLADSQTRNTFPQWTGRQPSS